METLAQAGSESELELIAPRRSRRDMSAGRPLVVMESSREMEKGAESASESERGGS
jgi:hypothetical protein